MIDFFIYIKENPYKYRGQDWKLSMIFSIWLKDGSPTKEDTDSYEIAVEPSPAICAKFLDLENGTLDGISPKVTPEQVKVKFPCFTGETEEGSSFNCGGGVFFLTHDFYFYTHRNYIEVRQNFEGEISSPSLRIIFTKYYTVSSKK